MTDIDGESVSVDTEGEPTNQVRVRTEPSVPAVFNPLDADPVQFKRALVARSENYDALAMHLRGILVADKDFGRIHIAPKSKCARPWQCTPEAEPFHFSPWTLFSPGGDKILGILGLAVTYPDEQDYRRTALKGLRIEDVIIKAYIDNGRGQNISEGMGAASRDQESGDLNRTIKKAEKRARMDAILRLPAISALFEDDFLAECAKQNNSTTKRARSVNQTHNTGAELVTFPLGGKLKGQRFADMDDGSLTWCVQTFDDKPDIKNSAIKELEKRASDPNTENASTDDYDNYPEAQ